MKKFLALLLCLLMVSAFFVSCNKEAKGPILDMYLSSEIRCFDPLYAYTNAISVEYVVEDAVFKNKLNANAESVELLGLLYEGLMKMDENGKVTKCLAKDITIVEKPEDDIYKMIITIKNTKWSDGQTVQAADFVYAITRILDPGVNCDAAALLFDIKNARAIKAGDISVDRIGVTAPDTDTIEIDFEKKIDYTLFEETLASPILVPLREDKVAKPLTDEDSGEKIYGANGIPAYSTDWSSTATGLVCNGPFFIRMLDSELGKTVVLERNKYYFLDAEKNESLQKYVKPFKINLHYEWTLEDVLASYNAGTLYYVGALTAADYAANVSNLTITDSFSTGCYIFNTKTELLQNPAVRRALSLALDRETIATYFNASVPATGLVPLPVYDTGVGTSYRNTYGAVIKTTAAIDEAKQVLKDAGVSGGSIKILARDYTVSGSEVLLAEYAKTQWEQLGFDVTVDKRGRNMFQTKFSGGEYDVIYTDWQTYTVRPFSVLAPFSVNFSGSAIDTENNDYSPKPNSTGYTSEAYDALIAEAYSFAEGTKERNDKLFEAEKMLMQDMPLIPLFFWRDYYMVGKDLGKFNTSYYGYHDFKRTGLAGYEEPVETED